jgi:MoaA/NifB/PqqE/SkfB family radical SAM enzyme
MKKERPKSRFDPGESLRDLGVSPSARMDRSDRVGEIYVMLTWRCNLRCRMCPMWGSRGFCRNMDLEGESISVNRVTRFIDRAAARGSRTVTLSGGEPLLSPLCIPLARKLADRGLKVMLTTNATLLRQLTPDDLGLFEQINVSLDGPPMVLERMRRGGEDTFGRAVDGLGRALEARRAGRPRLQLLTVITPEGVGHIMDMMERFSREGIAFDHLLFQHEMFLGPSAARRQKQVLAGLLGRSRDSTLWDALVAKANAVDVRALAAEIDGIRERWPGAVFSPRLDRALLRRYYAGGSWTPPGLKGFCFSPWFDLGITPFGDVWICPGFSAGNIMKDGFEDIWNGTRARRIRRALLSDGIFPGCRACFYLYNYREAP